VSFPSPTTIDFTYYGYSFSLALLSGATYSDDYSWFAIDTTTLISPLHTLSFDISDTSTGVDQYPIIFAPDNSAC
jgi:outer membrane usher protein FimD/PapC